MSEKKKITCTFACILDGMKENTNCDDRTTFLKSMIEQCGHHELLAADLETHRKKHNSRCRGVEHYIRADENKVQKFWNRDTYRTLIVSVIAGVTSALIVAWILGK